MAAVYMAIGFVLGAWTVAWSATYAFRLAVRYQRTGHADAPVQAEDKNGMPASAEGAAHRRVMEDAVQKGADEIMLMAEAQGDRITRQDAETQARAFLQSMPGMGNQGGVT